jgi:hypothetical protein
METDAPAGDPVDLPMLDSGVDEAPARRKDDDDAMAREVAAAPVEYHAQMPKLADLDVGSRWTKVQQKCSEEFDMSCLLNVLCQQLDDDDSAWNPDMLLVQLTSDLLDEVEQRDDDAVGSEDILKVERRRSVVPAKLGLN